MSRYNHFAKPLYESILFDDLKIGERFRIPKKVNRTVVAVKTGDLAYTELVNNEEKKLFHSNNYYVYQYEKRPLPPTK